MSRSISVIVPAFNEEDNIESTVQGILEALDGNFADYEILIFDDASTDKTGPIADGLAKINSRIHVLHNERNRGFGYNYRKGVELAGKAYVTMFPGDNSFSTEAMREVFLKTGQKDIIVPYTINFHVRPFMRRVISKTFTKMMNFLFGLRLRYYNGPVVHKSEIVKSVQISTSGYAYQAVILTKLIRSGFGFEEVGIPIQERRHGVSNALRFKNILSVSKALVKLFYEVRLRGQRISVN